MREKVVIEECEGVELNALDEGGVSLLFQDPENYDEVEDGWILTAGRGRRWIF